MLQFRLCESCRTTFLRLSGIIKLIHDLFSMVEMNKDMVETIDFTEFYYLIDNQPIDSIIAPELFFFCLTFFYKT